MNSPSNLLSRSIYSLKQVDRLLLLSNGTARRWIDGYARGGVDYPPVVRLSPTGSDSVTWGEFVEARLLSEYRDAGVPMVRMRPAVDKLREEFDRLYPLAHAQPFLDVAGKELVLKAQDAVNLTRSLRLVVVRNGQLVLTERASQFVRSIDFDHSGVPERLRPAADIPEVVVDPLRQFGEPVVRSVPTEVIAEQVRAGDSFELIAELYELSSAQVRSAVRYELKRLAQASVSRSA